MAGEITDEAVDVCSVDKIASMVEDFLLRLIWNLEICAAIS